jgi:hypothetical protein
VNELPLSTLLYRYFFFGWLFKEVGDATDPFQRAAIVRHNHRQAAWLPTYMLRWLWASLLLYGLAGAIELLFESPVMARWFYAGSAMCLGYVVSIVTAWIGMLQRRERT